MSGIRVGFMGAVLSHRGPRASWEGYRQMLLAEPRQQELVRRLAQTEDGRALLADSRELWRERGLDEAPFEFVLRQAEAGP
jgi:hypothetical protein